MAIGNDLLEKMVVAIAAGKTMPKNMSKERERVWRKLKKEMREIESKGGQVDIPSDAP